MRRALFQIVAFADRLFEGNPLVARQYRELF